MITILALVACSAMQPLTVQTPQLPARGIQVFGNCSFTGATHSMTFTPGMSTTNTFTSTADPELRKFIIYVPTNYQPQNGPYPVVYMLHGTSQTAQIAKNNTTWNHGAEVFDFIAVYPEALSYPLVSGGMATKWHTLGAELQVTTTMADDVTYLRELHNTIGNHLSIDCDRIYASGFSNGGAFVKTELRIHLFDIFAATTSAGGLGLLSTMPSDFYPSDVFSFRPHFEVVGNMDGNKQAYCVNANNLAPGQSLPRQIANIMGTPCMWDPLTSFAEALGLDPVPSSGLEQPGFTQIRWALPTLPGPGRREYRWHILPNLVHEYPSGTNYPIDYVPIYYQWMMQYTR